MTATAPAPRASQAELARLLGVSRQAINDLVKRGVLEVGRDGKIDVALARHALESRVRPSSKTGQALASAAMAAPPTAAQVLSGAVPAPAPPQALEASIDTSTDAPSVTSYHVAKTLRELAEARLAQLKLAEQRGELVRVADVKSAYGKRVTALREALLQIPLRIAPVVAAEESAGKCHEILQTEVHAVLRLLSQGQGTPE